jgi:hypothetical protein
MCCVDRLRSQYKTAPGLQTDERLHLANLLAYTDIISNVEVAMKAGKSHDEKKAMRPVDGYSMNREGFVTPDRFVETVYTSLGG